MMPARDCCKCLGTTCIPPSRVWRMIRVGLVEEVKQSATHYERGRERCYPKSRDHRRAHRPHRRWRLSTTSATSRRSREAPQHPVWQWGGGQVGAHTVVLLTAPVDAGDMKTQSSRQEERVRAFCARQKSEQSYTSASKTVGAIVVLQTLLNPELTSVAPLCRAQC